MMTGMSDESDHFRAWMKHAGTGALLVAVLAVAGLVAVRHSAAQTAQSTTRSSVSTYRYLRYRLPESWPVGSWPPDRKYGHPYCSMPGLPEGKYYRFFITDTGPVGPDLPNFYEQVFKDYLPGSPGRNGLKPQITTSPDGQTTMSQTLALRMRNGDVAHVFFCLLIMDGVHQCAGVITNDEQLWNDNLKYKEAFEASLDLDRDALLDRPYRSVSSPASRPAVTRPSIDETAVKSIVRQFMQATWEGDEKALSTQIVPLQESDLSRVRLLLEEIRQRQKLEQLVFSRFPKEQCAADWPERDPAAQLQHMFDAVQRATVVLNADTAIVQFERGDTPIEVRRVSGSWRVDLAKFLQQRGEFRSPRWQQETEARTKAAADTAAAIERGELKSVREARDAFEARTDTIRR